jgi:GNAT superfamily N-acetyltransferase
MKVHSLGYRTDLIFSRFNGEVIDRGEYLVIRTPANPTFYWGNYLLFAQPPKPGDYALWRDLFAAEIGPNPPVKHMVFGIDGANDEIGDIDAFLEAGFEIERNIILTASAVRQPSRANTEVTIRPLMGENEWVEDLEMQISCFQQDHEPAGYRIFATRAQAGMRAMIDAGLGQWSGAFLGETLTASLGLFVEDGVGRFQAVVTHPNFRRRGICGRLVYETARLGLETMGARVLVMAADPEYHAARIYEAVGFVPTEWQVGLQWVEK